MRANALRQQWFFVVVLVSPCFAQNPEAFDDGTRNGQKGPFLYVDFWEKGRKTSLNPWVGMPRLGIGTVEGKTLPFWLSPGDHITDYWAFEKIGEGYVIRYKGGHEYLKCNNWCLTYDLNGESLDVTVSKDVTDACMWVMVDNVRINRRRDFSTALKPLNGKSKDLFLGTEITDQPPLVQRGTYPKKSKGWRLRLTKERQAELEFSNIERG